MKIAWGIVWGIGFEIWEISYNSLNFNKIGHYFPIALSVLLYTLRPDSPRKNDKVEVKVQVEVELGNDQWKEEGIRG